MISMEEQLNTLGVKSIKPNGKAPKGTKSGPEFECTLDAHAIFRAQLLQAAYHPIVKLVLLFVPGLVALDLAERVDHDEAAVSVVAQPLLKGLETVIFECVHTKNKWLSYGATAPRRVAETGVV